MLSKKKRLKSRRKKAESRMFLAYSGIVDANIYTIFEASTDSQ